jgi:hypothetical protein
MAFALASGIITQTGIDTNLSGLVGLAGVTVNTSPNGMRFYNVDATITLIVINGTFSWDSDYECLVLSESTRVEQNAGSVVTIGAVNTVNGKIRYSRGTGLVINRVNSVLNTSGTSWWMKSSTSLALGSKLIVNGGQIKTRGSIFLGTTTNPVNQFATIELNGRAEVLNLATAAVQVIRSFVQPSGIQLVSGVLSGRTVNSSVFSSVGFGTLAVESDFASFQCDGNGPKDPVTVLNGVLANNKSATDYTYVTAGNLLANINKYIFQNPDVGSALRTIGASAGAWRQGVVEIKKDVRFEVVDSSNAPIEGAATYIKMLGASINPSGRYAGIDDYITPRAYVSETNASGLTTAASILYAVAQGYATDATGAGTALTMESLTTRAGDVQDGYIWSYGHLLGPTAVPMRGVNQLTVSWTLFADPSITLDETTARAKLASSFTVNPTTKIITVTANSSYEDLYDAMKAYKSTANLVNLEATPIDELLVKSDGTQLVGYTGWTLVINSGVTLNAGGKFSSLYFDSVTVNGTITGQYADSTGSVVTVKDINNRPTSTFITINGVPEGGTVVDGVFRAGWVPLATARQIKVQPTDAVRIYANWFGSKPGIINALGSEVDKFTIVLETSPSIDANLALATRNEIADIFSSIQNGANIEVTINQSMSQYLPSEVISGFAWYLVNYGHLIAAAMVQSNNANIYRLENGTVISFSPNYKLRMSDNDALGNPILPSIVGYAFPLVVYYDDGTGSKTPLTLLNVNGAKVELAQWTQIEASISDMDKQDIADGSAQEVWEYTERTLTNGSTGTGGATAQEVWEYVDRTLSVNIPTAIENASAVRNELNTEMGRIDAPISSTLASIDYVAPNNAQISQIKAKVDTLENTDLTGIALEATSQEILTTVQDIDVDFTPVLDAIDLTLKAEDYVAPDNAKIAEIKTIVEDKTEYSLTSAQVEAIAVAVESHLLDEGDGQMLLNAIAQAIGNENIDQVALVAAIRADMERSGGKITQIQTKVDTLENYNDTALEAKVDATLKTSQYTAPDNVKIGQIKTKVDTLENTNISTLATTAQLEEAKDEVLANSSGATPERIADQVWLEQPDRLKNVSTVQITGEQLKTYIDQ